MPLVLFDAHHLGEVQTGAETWTRNAIRSLSQLDTEYELHFVVTRRGSAEIANWTSGPWSIVSAHSSVRLSRDLPHLARSLNADLVFTHYTMALCAIPAIVLIHDLHAEHREARDWLPRSTRLRHRLSYRTSARFARALIVPSEFTRTELLELRSDKDSIFLAPEALDEELRKRIATRGPLRSRSHRYRVLMVGNVLPRKNHLLVAQALRLMIDSGVSIELRVVGTIPTKGVAIARRLHQILGDAVTFSGYVAIDQLCDEYLSADLLAYPSLFEGFGLPLLEAMEADLPVVSSCATTLPEIAGPAAILLSPQDPYAWAQAFERIRTDDDVRQRLVVKGRQRLTEFSWEKCAIGVDEALDYGLTSI